MTIHKLETGTARNVTAATLISLMRYTGLIENLDSLIPEKHLADALTNMTNNHPTFLFA